MDKEEIRSVLNGTKTVRIYSDEEILKANQQRAELKEKIGPAKFKSLMKQIYRAKKYGKEVPFTVESLIEENLEGDE